MKRTSIVAVITLLMMMLSTAVCYAEALEIVKSYPKDGGTSVQPVNCAVKIYFNQDVSYEGNADANRECFRISDPDGKSLPIEVYFDTKDETMVLVVLRELLADDTEYRLTVSGEFTATSGEMLETDRTITFQTMNQKTNTTISMIMMAVMFVGILFVSSKQMKRQAEKDADAKEKNPKVNPYKVSKKTGKSVEEVIKKAEKEKQKKAAEDAKYNPKENENENEKAVTDDDAVEGNRKVKGPRPISAGGSAYLSGKKAKAEAEAKRKAAARAAGTTKPKSKPSKKKNKKK